MSSFFALFVDFFEKNVTINDSFKGETKYDTHDRLKCFATDALIKWPMILEVADRMISTIKRSDQKDKLIDWKVMKKKKICSYFFKSDFEKNFDFLLSYVCRSGLFEPIIQNFKSVRYSNLINLSDKELNKAVLMTFGDWKYERICQKKATLARFGIPECRVEEYLKADPVVEPNSVEKRRENIFSLMKERFRD